MKTKFTPGKWHTHLTKKQSIEIYSDKKHGKICTLANRKAIEENANAKLIATAPELFKALQSLLKSSEGYTEKGNNESLGVLFVDQIYAKKVLEKVIK